ncbi:uncharacterized protein LOC117124429 [Anneissia japonica]|uniref:uncharacterized protein LOC117124429 n=1 Tax=Anneissia japonica TaxID=1529436 RepID=UPI001425526D|nr:uncharacterized protein LOC117124429 [Anneissia japonica]
MNLTRIDYTSLGDSFDYGVMTKTTRIDDFNTGVMYVINAADGNCSIQSIPTTDTFGRPVGQGGSIRIATAAELFYISDEYFYKGVFPFRDVDCNVYTDFRQDLGNTTFDWLISSDGWTATEEGNAGMTNIPIGLSVVTTEIGKI